MSEQIEWPEDDPAFIQWLEDRLEDARRAQDAEMEKKHKQKAEYWLEQTKGGDPC